MMLAHAKAVNIFKDNGYPGEIGVVHSLETKYANSDSEEDKHAAFLEDALSIRFLLEATYLGRYSEELLEALMKFARRKMLLMNSWKRIILKWKKLPFAMIS